jgi:hypothetical protein
LSNAAKTANQKITAQVKPQRASFPFRPSWGPIHLCRICALVVFAVSYNCHWAPFEVTLIN